jgi:hypothetical protein
MTFINILKNVYYCRMKLIKQKIAIRKWIKYVPVLSLVFLFSFSPNPKHKYTHIVDLPDSCFAYKHFTSSLDVKWFNKRPFTRYIKDTSKEIKLYSLDTTQEGKIIPLIIDIAFDRSGLFYSIGSKLLAREEKIGALKPIIFLVGGWDYGALIYVLLDKNDNPVSHFLLAGGVDAGPVVETDSLWVYPSFKVSYIKDNIISSYILHTQSKRGDSLAIYDSVSYRTVVSKNGEIKTSRIDSERYERMPSNHWNPFTIEPYHRKKSTK